MAAPGQIGIIGYGRFGALVARIIRSRFPGNGVLVFARKRQPGEARGIRFAGLDEVCRSDVLIPCVPISCFEEVIRSISGKIRPGSLLIDVCSVKVYPVEIMKKYVPAGVQILATHPNFGPDSARRGLAGLKIILYPVNISPARYDRIKRGCRDIGLQVIEMAPAEHDRLMAFSMAYTHLVGRIGQKMNLESTPVDTRGFAQLLKVQQYVVNDSLALFRDMQNFNPYAREMREQFGRALAKIEEELESSQ